MPAVPRCRPQSDKNHKRKLTIVTFVILEADMFPEPNFPITPGEFVGRGQQIETFRQALQQGLETGRTESFAVLGDWGVGKSSLLLRFAILCSQPPFAILPVFLSVLSDTCDYLRFVEVLLYRFVDALLAVPNMQARLRGKLSDWRFKRGNFGPGGRESSPLFLSSGKLAPQTHAHRGPGSLLSPCGTEGRDFLSG